MEENRSRSLEGAAVEEVEAGGEAAEQTESGEPEFCLWEGEAYTEYKSCRFFREHKFRFITSRRAYVFFTWVYRWVYFICRQYVDPYKFYPLPVKDQILRWQPLFAKHVSDALVRLDQHATARAQGGTPRRPYRTVLMRALLRTFWRRALLVLVGTSLLNSAHVPLVFVIRQALVILTEQPEQLLQPVLLAVALAFAQFAVAALQDHMNFYMHRLAHVVQYCLSITLFQHGLACRRRFGVANACNRLVHSCAPGAACSQHPLFCPALRHQSPELSARIFSFEFMDAYYVSLLLESAAHILQFLFNFLIGFYIVHQSIEVRLWPLYAFYLAALLAMLLVELGNTLLLRHLYGLKDFRLARTRQVAAGLDLVRKACLDDVALAAITRTRNDELRLLFLRLVLSFLNRLLVNVSSSFAIVHVLDEFIEIAFGMSDIRNFKTSHMMASMIVMFKISDSMQFVPESLKYLTYSLISYFRLEFYVRECAPNFYASSNRYTGADSGSAEPPDRPADQPTADRPADQPTDRPTDQPPSDQPPDRPPEEDVVVQFQHASFTWVFSRDDLLNKNYELYLKNVNFELKRGQMAIVTGAQGAGKSNLVRALLGDMTLVGGSLFVAPLHRAMPIFYAAQEVWLQHGTIRSNIVFGYKFDEQLYNAVLKAVELEFDIATWERGDLRVVYDNAHTLSGGQRVRMEMARAIYAYLVFHKVNVEYNDSRCSFLMLLDSPFHGLDPYVATAIFRNLFNQKGGLLVKEDLALVLTSTRRHLDNIALALETGAALYNIEDRRLELVRRPAPPGDPKYPSHTTNHNDSNHTNHLASLCEPEQRGPARSRALVDLYEQSLVVGEELKKRKDKLVQNLGSHAIYFRAAGLPMLLFLLFAITYMVAETFKYVLAGRLGDDIMQIVYTIARPSEYPAALAKIRTLCDDTLRKVKLLTLVIVGFCLLANLALSFGCLRGCRRIHEYCVHALVHGSAEAVRIKQFASEVLTFLSSDVFMIDENFGPCLSSLLILIVEIFLIAAVLGYYFPVCIPIIFLCLVSTVYTLFIQFLFSSRNLQLAALEALSRNNLACEKAVSSSATYRSFAREARLLDEVMEHTEYSIRSFFYSKSFLSWATFTSKFIFLFMMVCSFIAPLVLNHFKHLKSFIGNYGLNTMQTIRMIFSYTAYIVIGARFEMLMCSIKRFECFVPPGQKCAFARSPNPHAEQLVLSPEEYAGPGATEPQVRAALLKRRRAEFRRETRRFYAVRWLGFRPRVTITPPESLLPPHSGFELRGVCVFSSAERNPDFMILKNISVSARRSEIIGMVGRTGAGKTTLLSVLQNLAENRTGEVLLDGTDLNDIPKHVLRQIIGVLPQLPFVFRGWTIRRFLDPRKLFTDDDINLALDQCGLLRFVNDLPGGKSLDTVIIPDELASYMPTRRRMAPGPGVRRAERQAESEMLLSNTQLRTLSFARLVLYRALFRVILVDEPPVEGAEEAAEEAASSSPREGVPVYELLKRFFGHCTTFVTAHDSSALRMCTTVWILHEGAFMGSVSAAEILEANSISTIIGRFVR